MTGSVVMLSDDLMWLSRFAAVGKHLGITVRGTRTVEQTRQAIADLQPRCLILDLEWGRASAVAAELKPLLAPGAKLVAFGSHVDAASLADARAAGCEPVLSRGDMAKHLVDYLPAWVASSV